MNLKSVSFDPFATPALLKSTGSTDSQRELWTASQFGVEASAAFNEAVSLRLKGDLDRAALSVAFRALVAAHEALHTSFSSDGTSLLVEEPQLEVGFEDLSAWSESDRRAHVAERTRAEVSNPFDLRKAPLVRAHLLMLGVDEHLLLVSAHHIVCDGWSMGVLLKDLAALYSQAARGETVRLAERPRFSDYAEEEARRVVGADYRAAERYWLDRFAGDAPAATDLPSDRPRPALKTYASDRVDHVLDAALVAKFKALGMRRGATFFATLLAAFTTLIHRFTGADDVVVGVPVAGQSFTDRPLLVGHCVNMLPLRVTLSPELIFSDLLSGVRGSLMDAYEHQTLTFGALLRKLALPRDPSRLPLITLAFNVDQAVTGESLDFAGLRAVVATTPRVFENFDIFVNAAEKSGTVTLETQYNTDLYDRSSVERWLASFEVLVRAIVDEPGAALRDLDLVTAEEHSLFKRWNEATTRSYPPEASVTSFLLAAWASTAEQTAVVASDGRLTYAELDLRSAALARSLRGRGIGRGSLVGVALERSSRLLVAVLGVLRSGAAYVPLDPSFPRDRLAFMAEDARLALLISERALEADLPAPDIARHFLDDESTEPVSLSTDAAPSIKPDDPAYVIYTSGSTGKPKGVAVPHCAVVNFLRSMAEMPGLAAGDRLLAVTTLSFDIAVLELLLPLSVGATIVLATSTQAMDGSALRSLIAEQRANVMQATPATWRLLLAAGERFGPGFKALCGGEALPKALAGELLATGLELWNMYGPTETTVWSTCQRIAATDGRITVGRPIANTQIHIVDGQLRSVPLGVSGELCIAGAGVSLGYLGRPELNAEKFVANPFGAGRLYRTGDSARFLPSGLVECLGRGDGQVKVRGYRIELGEVESVLGHHEGVRQVVVSVREDRPGDQRLVAYVVPRQRMPDTEGLRAHLRRSVPDYMVPQHFVEMTALPLTPNGKIDKNRLPAPVASEGASSAGHVVVETESEKLLQKIWQGVLGLSRIGATDDFFQLGGHSLLAAHVVAQVARETGIDLSMRAVFEAPTLRGLATIVDLARGSNDRIDTIPRRAPLAPAPLSPMQQRLWFMEQMNPGTAVYNLPSCFRLRGQLDVRALQRALDAIAERHTTLRTTLGWRDGQLVQSVAPELKFNLTPIDFGSLPPSLREEKLLAALRGAAGKPFELSVGPLVRASLFLLGPSESVLFFMPHHAIWDGWSFDIFLDELDRLYAAFARGEASPLAPIDVTYGDYSVWQQRWLAGPELDRQTRFWLGHLAGELPILDLPTDAPRPASMTFAGATEGFDLDAEMVEGLTKVARRFGATLYMVLLAAFDVFLSRITGQTDIIVGTPVRGRKGPEVEPLLGYFVNALPLRVVVDPMESFSGLLVRVRDNCVLAFGHQDMPFEVLVQKLKISRDTSRTPLYSAFFTFQDIRNRKSSIGELSYEQIHVHAPVSPTDVSFWVKQHGSGIAGGIDYATDIIRRDTVLRWSAELHELLRAVVADADRPVGRIPVIPPEELRALTAVSANERSYPRDARLHELIEAQADRTPDSVAVTYEGQRLTYRELDARANRVARALREAGIGEGSRAGICLERSLDLLVAALAVQKSGAAYVPLDPAFPGERLQFMMEDADLAAMIIHERTRAEAPPAGAAKVIDLDAERERITLLAEARLPVTGSADGEAPVYVIYTSGSTGRPKGVVVPHRALVNFATSMVREPGIGPGDRLLAVTTLSFDIAVLELYVPLMVGAQVVMASREMASDGDLLDEAIDEHDVSIMQATPSTWRLLLGAGFRGRPRFKVLCGGEALAPDLAEKLLAVTPDVWNMYGPTETTVWSTCQRLALPLSEISIGRPIANTSVHVVDSFGQLAPWGTPGELWIGGDGVAIGYHSRAELTADRFVSNPFRPGRAYRTGDIVRLRFNGELVYVRRNDNQVKLRGYRVELGEVEAALSQLPGVASAFVIVREDRPTDRRLVAYIVAHQAPGKAASVDDLSEASVRKALRAHLPPYMIPQHVIVLDALPLTPNRKVDRGALPSPLGTSQSLAADFAEPQTEKEKMLATMWQEILGIARVGAHDNFFDVGGHSLLCLQMTARLERSTGLRINPRIILRNDLSQIAALLPDVLPAGGNEDAEPDRPQDRSRESLAQRLLGRLTGR